LNAGTNFRGSIAGYKISGEGKLIFIPNSAIALSTNSAEPAQISFTNNANVLAITEKATSKIVTFTVDANGLPVDKKEMASYGIEPFGFAVGQYGNIYVSEAYNGLAKKSIVSFYHVHITGDATATQPSVYNHQTASCWVVITEDNKVYLCS